MPNFKKNPIIYGALLLSLSGLFCRGIGFFYHIFISRTFGAEAMGIFQLTSPVLMLAFSLTGAGIQTAISNFVASSSKSHTYDYSKGYFYCGCFLSFLFSTLYSFVIYLFSDAIAVSILGEKKCAPLLRICAFSFPLSALHCCFNGYFFGRKNTKLPALTQIAEQLVRVGSVFFLYGCYHLQQQKPTIAITCVGMVLGEAAALMVSAFYYLSSSSNSQRDTQKQSQGAKFDFLRKGKTILQLLSFSFPLTLNRVIINLLQSYEAILLPASLKKFGYATSTALSIYGVLSGMALSFIMFPSTFTNSVSVLLMPTVAEAKSENHTGKIKKMMYRTIFFSLALGLFFTLLFYFSGHFFGQLLFRNTLAGRFIQTLSFLCPFLYLRVTLCSILNGLKKTKDTLCINLLSLFLRLGSILIFVPSIGIYGYLYGLLFSEVLSSLCCVYRLKKSIF